MSPINLDFRFLESQYELGTLEDYLRVLEEQLDKLTKQEQEKFETKIKNEIYQKDEAERQEAYQELYEHSEHLLPRFFRNPFLVTLWATFESAVVEIAKYLQEKKGLKLGISDIRGDNFLKQAQKYFDNVLNFPLGLDVETLKRLDMLRVLRNAIAHSNSRINAVRREDDKKEIKGWVKSKMGISLHSYTLIFSKHFLQETYVIMNQSLSDLLERVRQAYPEDIGTISKS